MNMITKKAYLSLTCRIAAFVRSLACVYMIVFMNKNNMKRIMFYKPEM